MAAKPLKSFTWRVSQIPKGTSKNAVIKYFADDDQERIAIRSLCPDVSQLGKLTATILFKPNPDRANDPPDTLPTAPEDLEIDKDFEGLTPLYCPPDGEPIAADIVAITGLAGHAFGSWAYSEDFMWLRDFAPRFGTHVRILTYGYDTNISGENTSATILADQAQAFLGHLSVAREETQCDKRPIIFIGHSLGCLIIKRAMTEAHDRECLLPVRAIVFMAAPHRGMDIEALQTLVNGHPPETLVQELKRGSPTLQDLSERFPRVLGNIQVLTVFETKKTRTVKKGPDNKWTRSGEPVMMVDAQSAKEYFLRETRVRSDGDHSTIAKLARKSNNGVFNAVRGLVIGALKSLAFAETDSSNGACELAVVQAKPVLHTRHSEEQPDTESEQDHRPPPLAHAETREALNIPEQFSSAHSDTSICRAPGPSRFELRPQHQRAASQPVHGNETTGRTPGPDTGMGHLTNDLRHLLDNFNDDSDDSANDPDGGYIKDDESREQISMNSPDMGHQYPSPPESPYQSRCLSPQANAGYRPPVQTLPVGAPNFLRIDSEPPRGPGLSHHASMPQLGGGFPQGMLPGLPHDMLPGFPQSMLPNFPQDMLPGFPQGMGFGFPQGMVPSVTLNGNVPPSIPNGVRICDGCNSEIKGQWFECEYCPDFDLCVNCFGSTAHPPHGFTRMLGI